jgi:hypothetical protein
MSARIRQACLFGVVAPGLVVVLAGATLAQSSTPTNIGAWMLDLAKSKFSADMAPTSAKFKVEAAGAGAKVTVDAYESVHRCQIAMKAMMRPTIQATAATSVQMPNRVGTLMKPDAVFAA